MVTDSHLSMDFYSMKFIHRAKYILTLDEIRQRSKKSCLVVLNHPDRINFGKLENSFYCIFSQTFKNNYDFIYLFIF